MNSGTFRKIVFTAILFISIIWNFHAQSFTISGYVSDKNSGERLLSATVFNSKDFNGTISNEYGFYSLTLPSDTVILNFNYIGFTSQKIKFFLQQDTIINIDLISSNVLEEVVISAENNSEQFQERTQMSTIEIPIEQIRALPAF